MHLAQRVSRSSATGTTNANWRSMKREILIHKLNYFGTDAGGSFTSGVIQAGLGLDVSPFQKGFSHFSFRGRLAISISGTPNLPLADTGKTTKA